MRATSRRKLFDPQSTAAIKEGVFMVAGGPPDARASADEE